MNLGFVIVLSCLSRSIDGTIEFGAKGGEASIEVNVGAFFSLRMETNPSTGYNWNLVGDLPTCLREISRVYEPLAKHSPVVGGKMILDMRFEGVSPCEESLTFKYGRLWEEKLEDSPSIRVHISIGSDEYL
jgi:predicted secreted protein